MGRSLKLSRKSALSPSGTSNTEVSPARTRRATIDQTRRPRQLDDASTAEKTKRTMVATSALRTHLRLEQTAATDAHRGVLD